MLQRRSTWFAFLAGFNLILVIWHITVQEPTIGAQQQQQQQTASGPIAGDFYGERGGGGGGGGTHLNGFNRKQHHLPGLGGGGGGLGGSEDGDGGGGIRGLVGGGGIGVNGNAMEAQLYAGKHLLSDMALGNESAMMGESTSATSGIGASSQQQPHQQQQLQQRPHNQQQQPQQQTQQGQPQPHQEAQQPPQSQQLPSQPQLQPQAHSSRAADAPDEEQYGLGGPMDEVDGSPPTLSRHPHQKPPQHRKPHPTTGDNSTNHSGAIKTAPEADRSQEDHYNNSNTTNTSHRPSPHPATTPALPHLPDDDFGRLMDLRDFSFQLDQPACDRHVHALILVHSAPSNFHKRSIIRETWGSRDYLRRVASPPKVRLIFLLGTLADGGGASDGLQAQLEAENASNGDLVQGTFVDNYRNMTYKHVMAFKWLLYRCQAAELLIKLDDDVFLNMPLLHRYLGVNTVLPPGVNNEIELPPRFRNENGLPPRNNNENELPSGFQNENELPPPHRYGHKDEELPPPPAAEKEPNFSAMASRLTHPPDGLLLCHKHVGSYVKRSYRSKWRVGYKEYPGRIYPPYCPGFAIFYSRHVARQLYAAAQQHAYFWIDDVLITGVLAQEQNITITNVSPYMWHKVSERDPGRLVEPGQAPPQFLISGHALTDRHIRALWSLVSGADGRDHRSGGGGGAPQDSAESAEDSGMAANTLGR